MRIICALLTAFVVSSGSALAQGQDTGRGAYPPYGYRVFTDWHPSDVRLDILPHDAELFVDKHYTGPVSDFQGAFQRLTLHAGPHLIEVRRAGFSSLAVELNLYPGQTVTLSRTLTPNSEQGAIVEAFAPSFEEGAFLPPAERQSGELRFDVKPKDAEIYADGFYVGIVDDFNGSQHMMLTQGQHHLVLKREGHETLDLNLSIDSERTITYRATMRKLVAR